MLNLSLVALIIFGSSVINALTGFGFIIVAAPLLVHLLAPKDVAATALLLGFVISVLVVWKEREHIDLRVVGFMAFAALFGIPLGTAILERVSGSMLKVLVGSVVILATVPLSAGLQLPTKHARPLSAASGFLSGVLAGICGISGAIAALFFMGQGWEPRKIRPTISGFNAVVSSLTLIWLLTTHSIGRNEVLSAAMFLPLVFIGLALSNLVRPRVDGRHFRTITFVLVVVAGVLAVIAGVIEMVR